MVQVDIMGFWSCDFFQVVQSSILVIVISFLIVKTPLLCSTDLKLSSVQHHSVSLIIYINFSDSALSTLISAEHSDQCWTDLSGPLLSPFPANLAGEGGKLTLISADQKSALADQNMWGRDKTSAGEMKFLKNGGKTWQKPRKKSKSLEGHGVCSSVEYNLLPSTSLQCLWQAKIRVGS